MLVAFLLPKDGSPTWIPLVVGILLIAGTCLMFYIRERRIGLASGNDIEVSFANC